MSEQSRHKTAMRQYSRASALTGQHAVAVDASSQPYATDRGAPGHWPIQRVESRETYRSPTSLATDRRDDRATCRDGTLRIADAPDGERTAPGGRGGDHPRDRLQPHAAYRTEPSDHYPIDRSTASRDKDYLHRDGRIDGAASASERKVRQSSGEQRKDRAIERPLAHNGRHEQLSHRRCSTGPRWEAMREVR